MHSVNLLRPSAGCRSIRTAPGGVERPHMGRGPRSVGAFISGNFRYPVVVVPSLLVPAARRLPSPLSFLPGASPHELYIMQMSPLFFISLVQLAACSFDIPEYDLPGFPEGYVYYPGMGYYKFYANGKTWFEAERVCSSEGAHLAVVSSNSEALILSYIFSKYENLNLTYNHLALIGFHDIYKEGEYLAVNGVPLEKTGYAVWESGEPNDKEKGNEDCGAINREGKLADVYCDAHVYAFICEIDYI